jgi:hypothetical protein
VVLMVLMVLVAQETKVSQPKVARAAKQAYL